MTIGQETSGNNDSVESTAEQEKPLRESLADASVLLWYATREGKQVSEETIGDIVLAQSSLSGGRRDPEVEARFWVALRALAAAVQPPSVDSILATYGYPFGDYNKTGKHRLVDAASTKKAYNIGAIVVLSILLMVQIYWFVGTTFRNDLELHRTELDQIAGSLREMNLAARAGREYIKIKEQQIPNPSNNELLFDKSTQFTFGLTKEIEVLK